MVHKEAKHLNFFNEILKIVLLSHLEIVKDVTKVILRRNLIQTR